MRPESRLLFLTAWGPAGDSSIRELVPSIRNWPRFIAIAELERATRVVWERFETLGVTLPSDCPADQLQQLATVAAFRAEHMKARLHETLEAFAREGIDVVLLKGAALACTLYPSFLDRPMGDLDLLVAAEHAERAHRVARAAGWRWDEAAFPFARYAAHHHLPPLDDAAGTGVRLELHRGIAIEGHPFALSPEQLRARCREVPVGVTRAWVPSAEHLLLHECVHFAWSHVLSFGAWRMARDLQIMCRLAPIDWDLFVRDAQQHRADSCAYWTLVLARLLSGADVPASVLERCRPAMSSATQRVLERHFVYHLLPIEQEWPSQWLRRKVWEKAMQPGRYGHGLLRPWELDDDFERPIAAPTPTLPERVARLGVWARYVRALS